MVVRGMLAIPGQFRTFYHVLYKFESNFLHTPTSFLRTLSIARRPRTRHPLAIFSFISDDLHEQPPYYLPP